MTLELRTPRLLLRPVRADDLDVLLAIRNAPAVLATTSTGAELPRDTMEGQLGRRLDSWREHAFGSWLVLLDDVPVAFVEVAPIGEGSGVDPGNDRSLRALAKAPGVRRVDDELFRADAGAATGRESADAHLG